MKRGNLNLDGFQEEEDEDDEMDNSDDDGSDAGGELFFDLTLI